MKAGYKFNLKKLELVESEEINNSILSLYFDPKAEIYMEYKECLLPNSIFTPSFSDVTYDWYTFDINRIDRDGVIYDQTDIEYIAASFDYFTQIKYKIAYYKKGEKGFPYRIDQFNEICDLQKAMTKIAPLHEWDKV